MIARFVQRKGLFANCKKCDRPYPKGENYPDEVCPSCVRENEIGEED